MSTHTVQRLRFEVDVTSPAQGHALQESISVLRTSGIEPVLDACLSGLVGDDQFLHLDSLEIELGSISVQRMSSELGARIESALSSALISALHSPTDSLAYAAPQPIPLHMERLRQLETFLERGVLSWSAVDRALGLDGLLDSLIEVNPDALRRSLVGSRYRAIRCQRLATQFTRGTLKRLLRMLLHHRADVVVACIDALVRIQGQKPLVTATGSQFETVLWAAVLNFLLSVHRIAFDEERFVRHIIRALAHHYRVTPEALAEGLRVRMAFVALDFTARSVLLRSLPARIARTIAKRGVRAKETPDGGPHSNATSSPASPEPLGEMATLLQLLEQGRLPARNHGLVPESSQRWLTELLRRRPDDLVAALKALGERADVIRRLVQNFDWDAHCALVQALEPDYAGFILTYLLTGERFAVQRPGVRQAHWCATLSRLLDPHGRRFETTSFVNESSYCSARRLSMPHADYLQGLLQSARAAARTEERFAPLEEILAAILDRLETTHAGARTVPAAPGDAGVEAGTELDLAPFSQPSRSQLKSTLFLTRYFLQYGSFPQWADTSHAPDLHRRIAEALASRSGSMQALLGAAAARPLPRMRMATLFPPDLLNDFISRMLPDAAPLVLSLLELLRGRRRNCAAELLLACSAEASKHHWDGAVVLRRVLAGLARVESITYPDLLLELRASARERAEDGAVKFRPILNRLAVEAPAESPLDARSALPAHAAAEQSEPRNLADDEPIYVGNAGIILLWPFLGRYFELLAMLDDGRFRNPECRHRAVHLLQFIVAGGTGAAEHELLLNKILCGMYPFEPVEAEIVMTESESQLSAELLHGVCQNWPPLRNTSTQGFRESFLCREGRLLFKDDTWLLAVSGKSYDLLLDSLPWNLSMIRLPWMKYVLKVQWR